MLRKEGEFEWESDPTPGSDRFISQVEELLCKDLGALEVDHLINILKEIRVQKVIATEAMKINVVMSEEEVFRRATELRRLQTCEEQLVEHLRAREIERSSHEAILRSKAESFFLDRQGTGQEDEESMNQEDESERGTEEGWGLENEGEAPGNFESDETGGRNGGTGEGQEGQGGHRRQLSSNAHSREASQSGRGQDQQTNRAGVTKPSSGQVSRHSDSNRQQSKSGRETNEDLNVITKQELRLGKNLKPDVFKQLIRKGEDYYRKLPSGQLVQLDKDVDCQDREQDGQRIILKVVTLSHKQRGKIGDPDERGMRKSKTHEGKSNFGWDGGDTQREAGPQEGYHQNDSRRQSGADTNQHLEEEQEGSQNQHRRICSNQHSDSGFEQPAGSGDEKRQEEHDSREPAAIDSNSDMNGKPAHLMMDRSGKRVSDEFKMPFDSLPQEQVVPSRGTYTAEISAQMNDSELQNRVTENSKNDSLGGSGVQSRFDRQRNMNGGTNFRKKKSIAEMIIESQNDLDHDTSSRQEQDDLEDIEDIEDSQQRQRQRQDEGDEDRNSNSQLMSNQYPSSHGRGGQDLDQVYRPDKPSMDTKRSQTQYSNQHSGKDQMDNIVHDIGGDLEAYPIALREPAGDNHLHEENPEKTRPGFYNANKRPGSFEEEEDGEEDDLIYSLTQDQVNRTAENGKHGTDEYSKSHSGSNYPPTSRTQSNGPSLQGSGPQPQTYQRPPDAQPMTNIRKCNTVPAYPSHNPNPNQNANQNYNPNRANLQDLIRERRGLEGDSLSRNLNSLPTVFSNFINPNLGGQHQSGSGISGMGQRMNRTEDVRHNSIHQNVRKVRKGYPGSQDGQLKVIGLDLNHNSMHSIQKFSQIVQQSAGDLGPTNPSNSRVPQPNSGLNNSHQQSNGLYPNSESNSKHNTVQLVDSQPHMNSHINLQTTTRSGDIMTLQNAKSEGKDLGYSNNEMRNESDMRRRGDQAGRKEDGSIASEFRQSQIYNSQPSYGQSGLGYSETNERLVRIYTEQEGDTRDREEDRRQETVQYNEGVDIGESGEGPHQSNHGRDHGGHGVGDWEQQQSQSWQRDEDQKKKQKEPVSEPTGYGEHTHKKSYNRNQSQADQAYETEHNNLDEGVEELKEERHNNQNQHQNQRQNTTNNDNIPNSQTNIETPQNIYESELVKEQRLSHRTRMRVLPVSKEGSGSKRGGSRGVSLEQFNRRASSLTQPKTTKFTSKINTREEPRMGGRGGLKRVNDDYGLAMPSERIKQTPTERITIEQDNGVKITRPRFSAPRNGKVVRGRQRSKYGNEEAKDTVNARNAGGSTKPTTGTHGQTGRVIRKHGGFNEYGSGASRVSPTPVQQPRESLLTARRKASQPARHHSAAKNFGNHFQNQRQGTPNNAINESGHMRRSEVKVRVRESMRRRDSGRRVVVKSTEFKKSFTKPKAQDQTSNRPVTTQRGRQRPEIISLSKGSRIINASSYFGSVSSRGLSIEDYNRKVGMSLRKVSLKSLYSGKPRGIRSGAKTGTSGGPTSAHWDAGKGPGTNEKDYNSFDQRGATTKPDEKYYSQAGHNIPANNPNSTFNSSNQNKRNNDPRSNSGRPGKNPSNSKPYRHQTNQNHRTNKAVRKGDEIRQSFQKEEYRVKKNDYRRNSRSESSHKSIKHEVKYRSKSRKPGLEPIDVYYQRIERQSRVQEREGALGMGRGLEKVLGHLKRISKNNQNGHSNKHQTNRNERDYKHRQTNANGWQSGGKTQPPTERDMKYSDQKNYKNANNRTKTNQPIWSHKKALKVTRKSRGRSQMVVSRYSVEKPKDEKRVSFKEEMVIGRGRESSYMKRSYGSIVREPNDQESTQKYYIRDSRSRNSTHKQHTKNQTSKQQNPKSKNDYYYTGGNQNELKNGARGGRQHNPYESPSKRLSGARSSLLRVENKGKTRTVKENRTAFSGQKVAIEGQKREYLSVENRRRTRISKRQLEDLQKIRNSQMAMHEEYGFCENRQEEAVKRGAARAVRQYIGSKDEIRGQRNTESLKGSKIIRSQTKEQQQPRANRQKLGANLVLNKSGREVVEEGLQDMSDEGYNHIDDFDGKFYVNRNNREKVTSGARPNIAKQINRIDARNRNRNTPRNQEIGGGLIRNVSGREEEEEETGFGMSQNRFNKIDNFDGKFYVKKERPVQVGSGRGRPSEEEDFGGHMGQVFRQKRQNANHRNLDLDYIDKRGVSGKRAWQNRANKQANKVQSRQNPNKTYHNANPGSRRFPRRGNANVRVGAGAGKRNANPRAGTPEQEEVFQETIIMGKEFDRTRPGEYNEYLDEEEELGSKPVPPVNKPRVKRGWAAHTANNKQTNQRNKPQNPEQRRKIVTIGCGLKATNTEEVYLENLIIGKEYDRKQPGEYNEYLDEEEELGNQHIKKINRRQVKVKHKPQANQRRDETEEVYQETIIMGKEFDRNGPGEYNEYLDEEEELGSRGNKKVPVKVSGSAFPGKTRQNRRVSPNQHKVYYSISSRKNNKQVPQTKDYRRNLNNQNTVRRETGRVLQGEKTEKVYVERLEVGREDEVENGEYDPNFDEEEEMGPTRVRNEPKFNRIENQRAGQVQRQNQPRSDPRQQKRRITRDNQTRNQQGVRVGTNTVQSRYNANSQISKSKFSKKRISPGPRIIRRSRNNQSSPEGSRGYSTRKYSPAQGQAKKGGVRIIRKTSNQQTPRQHIQRTNRTPGNNTNSNRYQKHSNQNRETDKHRNVWSNKQNQRGEDIKEEEPTQEQIFVERLDIGRDGEGDRGDYNPYQDEEEELGPGGQWKPQPSQNLPPNRNRAEIENKWRTKPKANQIPGTNAPPRNERTITAQNPTQANLANDRFSSFGPDQNSQNRANNNNNNSNQRDPHRPPISNKNPYNSFGPRHPQPSSKGQSSEANPHSVQNSFRLTSQDQSSASNSRFNSFGANFNHHGHSQTSGSFGGTESAFRLQERQHQQNVTRKNVFRTTSNVNRTGNDLAPGNRSNRRAQISVGGGNSATGYAKADRGLEALEEMVECAEVPTRNGQDTNEETLRREEKGPHLIPSQANTQFPEDSYQGEYGGDKGRNPDYGNGRPQARARDQRGGHHAQQQQQPRKKHNDNRGKWQSQQSQSPYYVTEAHQGYASQNSGRSGQHNATGMHSSESGRDNEHEIKRVQFSNPQVSDIFLGARSLKRNQGFK